MLPLHQCRHGASGLFQPLLTFGSVWNADYVPYFVTRAERTRGAWRDGVSRGRQQGIQTGAQGETDETGATARLTETPSECPEMSAPHCTHWAKRKRGAMIDAVPHGCIGELLVAGREIVEKDDLGGG